MVHIDRLLNIDLSPKQSAFLWDARKTGNSTFLRSSFPDSLYKDITLLNVLNRGMIPAHYMQPQYKRSLKAYVQDYLREEVFNEGLTRNFPAFSRFFDAMAWSHGEMTNFANIAREVGIDAKTVRRYYYILVDTLLGAFVFPYARRQNRQVLSKTPKFYLFDVGVAGAIAKRELKEARGELFGKAFEHFIFTELRAYSSLKEIDFEISYWRTKSGMEVDFILGDGDVAIEVKGKNRLDAADMKSLCAFSSDNTPQKSLIVCNEKVKRKVGDIVIYPWREFLADLWAGEIIR